MTFVRSADSGGSSRRLMDEFGQLPFSDLRQALVALSRKGRLWRDVFTYRFEKTNGNGGGKKPGGGVTTTTVTQWHLREDVVDERTGMPRDLNGNNVIDTANHSSDYLILPVRVKIEWKGSSGARRFEIDTQLGDFRLESAP